MRSGDTQAAVLHCPQLWRHRSLTCKSAQASSVQCHFAYLSQSLTRAKRSADARDNDIFAATCGIFFFSTPHKGLPVEDIRELIFDDPQHPRHGLLDQLKQDSEPLLAQLADLKNIIHDRKIVSFYEEEQTRQLELVS